MEDFWKAAAAVLLAAILGLVLDRQSRDLAAVLNIAACAMVGMLAVTYLEPVLELLRELEAAGGLQDDFLGILLKAVGVGVGTELIALVCTDAGRSSLGKTLQMLGSSVILYLSVPIFRAMLMMIRQILGTL